MTKIFGDTDKETAKAAKPEPKKQAKPVTDPAPDPLAAKSKPSPVSAGSEPGPGPVPPAASHAASQPRRATPRKAVAKEETAAALPFTVNITPAIPIAAPIVKVPTAEDLANVKVGTTADDLFTALGQPSSRVIIPDDDGHLREICQYWANGRVLGTVRLDNGQVATVEPRPEN
jgi:hypothetical protein